MPFNYGLCPCAIQQSTRYYVRRLIEEMGELIHDRNMDELGDVMCILSYILHNITGLVIVLPFASKSLAKGRRRANQHGCVRSLHNSCQRKK